LRRERDDESVNAARHDGTGQRHGRRGNAGRIASIAVRLLSERSLSERPSGPTPKPSKLRQSLQKMSVERRYRPGFCRESRFVAGRHGNCFFKMQFNGAPGFSGLSLLVSSRTALAPGGGVELAAERTAPPHLMPPNETGGAARLLRRAPMIRSKPLGVCR
jgi:hypothetical protein